MSFVQKDDAGAILLLMAALFLVGLMFGMVLCGFIE